MSEKIEKVKELIAVEKEMKPAKKIFKKFSADDFKESYTAREYLDKQSPKFKQAAYDTIPNVIGMLKSTMTQDDILDLDVTEYASLLKAYSSRMGIVPQKIDFLGKK